MCVENAKNDRKIRRGAAVSLPQTKKFHTGKSGEETGIFMKAVQDKRIFLYLKSHNCQRFFEIFVGVLTTIPEN